MNNIVIPPEKSSQSPFTSRAFIAGLVLSAVIGLGGPYINNILQSGDLTATLTTPLAIFLFFVLAFLVNPVVGKIRRNCMFSGSELILIYIMMSVASAIPTMGFIGQLLPILLSPSYYATPENRWAELILPHIPGWMTIHDQNAIKYFFEGTPEGVSIPWSVWIKPLSYWLIFMLAFYFVTICMMVILRKQWVENERLNYPLVQLPQEMAKLGEKGSVLGPFFKNNLMWLGFAIPFLIGVINGLAHYFPAVTKIDLYAILPIFRNTGSLTFFISFPLLGFIYFVNLDIAFSLWFFYLLTLIITGYLKITGAGMVENLGRYGIDEPMLAHQVMGAMIIFVLLGLWRGRHHLHTVVRRAIGRGKNLDDSQEMLSYPIAFWGMIIGLLVMTAWIRASGLTLWATAVFLFAAFIIFIGLTYIVAKTGMPYVVPPMIAATFLVSGVGGNAIGVTGLVALSLTYVWSADLCVFLMPSVAHSLKLTSKEINKKSRLFWAIMIAIIIAATLSVWITLTLTYKHGGLNLSPHFYQISPQSPFSYISNKINTPTLPNLLGWIHTGIGALIMFFLVFMKQRFLWWPLEPVGLLLGPIWFMGVLWFNVFIIWLVKLLLLKYGGPEVYNRGKPLFLGFILGQFTIAGIWLVIDLFTGMTGNSIFWI
ncbi:MAG: DUF6785 family protein [Candidatus Omnitrophota bacterium]